MQITCRFFRRQPLEVSWRYLVGYPNKPACGGVPLSGNGLNSFDPGYDSEPLEIFELMLRKVVASPKLDDHEQAARYGGG